MKIAIGTHARVFLAVWEGIILIWSSAGICLHGDWVGKVE